MLVGNGENVLVSVASVAVNRRIGFLASHRLLSSSAKLGRCRRYTATEGSEASSLTHDPSVGVRRRHLPLLRKGRKILLLRNDPRRKPDAVSCDGARRGEPNFLAMSRDVAQRTLEMPQAMWLADQVGMQRDPHHQRPRLRKLQHLVEVIDDHVGEVRSMHLA